MRILLGTDFNYGKETFPLREAMRLARPGALRFAVDAK